MNTKDAIAILFVFVLTACTPLVADAPNAKISTPSLFTPLLPSPIPSPVFSGIEAMRYLESQMAFGPRPTGSNENIEAGDYILAQLSLLGWETDIQSFVYRGVPVRNLVGKSIVSSNDPVVLVGTHYDTRSVADRDQNAPQLPVPGANDGGSGAAVLLELARVVDRSRLSNDVWLVFFDAEDNGNLDGWSWGIGSRFFSKSTSSLVKCVLVVDMIGDLDQKIYIEANSDSVLSEKIWDVAADLGYSSYFVPEVRYSIVDDHTPFLEKGIPSVDIIDFDYDFWHTTEDTLDKVSADSLERVGRVLEFLLENGDVCAQ